MKYVLWLAAFSACNSAPAVAQTAPDRDQIEVNANTGMAAWANDIERKLDSGIHFPWVFPEWRVPEGTVTVTFRPGSDGRARDIAVVDHSGDRRLIGAALEAVARIDGIGPLPGSDGATQSIRANIIFAESESSLDRQMAVVRSKELTRIASERGNGQRVTVLNLSPRTRG